MPAGLTERDEMMFTGETPWHRQGVALDGPATAAEAIAAANLGWNVIQEPVYVRQSGVFRPVDDKLAITRQDTSEVFAIMGKGYEPLQNVQAFQFFDDVIARGEAVYHTAGSLFGGRRIWILAKLPEDITIGNSDKVEPYILLSNSHDGSKAVRMQTTPIRVVCWNTLNYAMSSGSQGFYGKHTRNILNKAEDARRELDLVHAYYQMFAKQADQLLNTKMTVIDVQRYLQEVYQFKADKPYAKQDHRRVKAYEGTLDLLGHPTNTFGGMAGSAWAAFNAVTYFVDHERAVRGSLEQRDDKRLDGSWFGTGAKLRQRAFDLLQV